MKMESSFPPIADGETRILILGSLPGAESLRRQEYYAHGRNRFWKVIAALAGEKETTVYAERVRMLKGLGLGLWDVAGQAVRPGSLDSDIRKVTPNDIAGLMELCPRIHTVIFNGRKAEELYRKHFTEREGVRYVYLPSTSPANAGCKYEQLLEEWRRVISPASR